MPICPIPSGSPHVTALDPKCRSRSPGAVWNVILLPCLVPHSGAYVAGHSVSSARVHLDAVDTRVSKRCQEGKQWSRDGGARVLVQQMKDAPIIVSVMARPSPSEFSCSDKSVQTVDSVDIMICPKIILQQSLPTEKIAVLPDDVPARPCRRRSSSRA